MSPVWSVLSCLFLRLTTTWGLDIKCPHKGNYRHGLPGTRCRQYYECKGGFSIQQRSCPEGTYYSSESRACKVGGNCYELLCMGRVDGRYSDATEGCTRWYECSGGLVTAVESCSPGYYFNEEKGKCTTEFTCRQPKSSAIRIEKIPNPCADQDDGTYPVRGTSIFVKCVGQVEVETHQCPIGQNFERSNCERIMSLADVCHDKQDGYHVEDGSNCTQYVFCKNRKIVLKSFCPYGSAFDGKSCVQNVSCSTKKVSKGEVHNDCEFKSPGFYSDQESNCRSYYYCADGKKITYICPPNEIFNGEKCISREDFNCPVVNTECANLHDGYHRRTGLTGSLQDYIYCSDGDKLTTLQCGMNEVYDGEKCVDAGRYSSKCHNVKFGFVANPTCKIYYLCEDEKVERSGVCLDGFIFNGKTCSPRAHTKCNRGSVQSCAEAPNGFYPDFNTDCSQYFYCISGKKTSLSCPTGRIFNGDFCVPKHTFVCPSTAVN